MIVLHGNLKCVGKDVPVYVYKVICDSHWSMLVRQKEKKDKYSKFYKIYYLMPHVMVQSAEILNREYRDIQECSPHGVSFKIMGKLCFPQVHTCPVWERRQ